MWKPVSKYETKYWVNENGEVKNSDGHILKPFKVGNGYYAVKLWNSRKPQNIRVHRLVAMAFVDNPNNYAEVNHINEDKADNRAENLEWCNRKQNCNHGERNKKIAEFQHKKWGKE